MKVAHFMATVDDYERLEAAYPMPKTINWVGHRDDEANRWIVVMHALMLRKYFQPGDKLQLSVVVPAVHACVVKNDYPQQEWDDWEREAEVFETKTLYNFGPDQYNESQLLEHHLYGRYLHGDYGKWMTTEGTPMSASDGGLWSATHARRIRVCELAAIVRGGVEDGALVYTE